MRENTTKTWYSFSLSIKRRAAAPLFFLLFVRECDNMMMKTLFDIGGVMISRELKAKIGRLFMIGIPGERLTDGYISFCEKNHIGNFCTNAANAYTLDGLCSMTRGLRELALRTTGEYPFITIDQEGGFVTRLYEGASLIPSAMAYSAINADRERMTEVGGRIGAILRAAGVCCNDAPVLDVNINPDNPIIGSRSYSDRVEEVIERGVGFAIGIESSGVMSVVKHFPGHGNVSADTHLGYVVNNTDADTLRKTEFLTFKRAFEAGVGAIMTAHVVFSAFSPLPATLSPEIITDLLRGEMGFDGVVITDAMQMRAIAGEYPDGEAAVMAIEAGCDQILCYSFDERYIEESLAAVCRAVESGRISEERIDRSIERITRQKEKYGIPTAEPNAELAKRLAYDACAIDESYSNMLGAITRIWDDGTLGNLSGKRILCVAPVYDAVRGVEESRRIPLSFADELAAALDGAIACPTSFDGPDEELIARINGEYDLAFFGILDVNAKPQQLDVLRLLLERGKPVVAVLLKSPYDAKYVSECNSAITCYGYTTLAVKATTEAIKNNDYRGTLPILNL